MQIVIINFLIGALILHVNVGFAEKYIDKFNPNLELCKEFKLYIERHPDKPLYCGLVADPQFKDFRLPKFKEAPAGLGTKLSMQFSANDNIGPRKTLENWKRMLQILEDDMANSEYTTTILDLDHDGRQDQVLMNFRKGMCASQKILSANMFVYGEDELLRQDFSGLGGYKLIKGLTFFYRGRVYVMSGSQYYLNLHEPLRTSRGLVQGGASICKYLSKDLLK